MKRCKTERTLEYSCKRAGVFERAQVRGAHVDEEIDPRFPAYPLGITTYQEFLHPSNRTVVQLVCTYTAVLRT